MALHFDRFKNQTITFYDRSGLKRKLCCHEFFLRASVLAHTIQSRSIIPRTGLIIQARQNYDQLLLFWGAILADLVPAPLAFADSPQRRHKVQRIKDLLPNCAVLSNEIISSVPDLQVFFLDTKAEFKEALADGLSYEKIFFRNAAVRDTSQPFFWQFSSGSTSNPKGVAMSWSMIQTNIREALTVLKCDSLKDRFLSWMPMTHDFGMIMGHLAPLINGSDQILMSSRFFLRHPEAWLKIAAEERCSLLTTTNFANHFFYRRCSSLKNRPDLFGIKAIINGAEPIVHSITKDFHELLQSFDMQPQALTAAYGLAEGTLVVTIKDLSDKCYFLEIDSRYVGIGAKVKVVSKVFNSEKPKLSSFGIVVANVGKPIPSIELKVFDNLNEPLEDLEIGHIFIKGPTVTANILEAQRQRDTSEGYLTGDIGFNFNGCLYLLGRAKDHFKSNGLSYFSNEIEAFFTDKVGIPPGQCIIVKNDFGENDEVVCFIREFCPESYRKMANLIFATCCQQFGLEINRFFQVAKVPRTTSGKIQRFKLVVDCFSQNKAHKNNFKNPLTFCKDAFGLIEKPCETDGNPPKN